MAGSLVAPALPAMKGEFSDTPGVDFLLILILTLPGLTVALFAPVAGVIADRIGRRPVLVAGLVLYGFSGALPIAFDSLPLIVAGRAALGAAVGCTMTAATALIFDCWHGAERERAIGLQSASTGVGGLIYPLLAGALVSLNWRAPFAVYLVAFPLAIIATTTLPNFKPTISRASATPNGRVLRKPIGFILGIGFLAMMIMYIIPVRGPFYLRELGYPAPLLIALMTTIPCATATVAGLVFAGLRSRLTPQSLTGLAFAMLAFGFAMMSLVPNVYALFLGLAFCGVGFGLNSPNLTSWLQSRVPPDQRGRAAGLFTTSVFLGQFASTFAAAALARHTSFSETFGLVAAICLAVSIVGFAAAAWRFESIRRSHRRARQRLLVRVPP